MNPNLTKTKVLKSCTVEGNIVKLPDEQLPRKIYLEVKKSLELIGGKWKGGKISGFIFPIDPTNLLTQIANGEAKNLKKEYQFFETPSTLAAKLVGYAELKPFDTVLELSAGQGVIVSHINRKGLTPDCFEIMQINRDILGETALEFNIVGENFLKSSDKKYTKIIANPPFSKNQDIEHVRKMYAKLEAGGRLVSIMSKHWQLSNNKKGNCL